MKWINMILFFGALYSIYQAARIELGWAILVSALWFVVFTQLNKPNHSQVTHNKAAKSARSQSDLIGRDNIKK